MDQIQELLGLPVQLLSVLVTGYLSYRLACTGRAASHKSVDVVFLVFVFAFVAKLTGGLAGVAASRFAPPLLADAIALLFGATAALGGAAIWRKWAEKRVFKFLRGIGVSHSDRHVSAWRTIVSKSGMERNSLIIRKTDGSVLKSEHLARFNDFPFGSCIYGPDGSGALYVTHYKGPEDTDWRKRDPSDHEDRGAKVTIIPASAISEIDLRAR